MPNLAPQLPKSISPVWRHLALTDEVVSTWLEIDLDDHLQFSSRWLLLTNKRLVEIDPAKNPQPGRSNAHEKSPATRVWMLDQIAAVATRESPGAGSLEIIGPDMPSAVWRFTNAQLGAANRLARRFDSLKRQELGNLEEVSTTICPSCGAVLSADDAECPACKPDVGAPTANVLWRLTTFGRNWVGVITLGFLLTLASTGVSLVPPYLTRPLVDDVLIPLQEKRITLDYHVLLGYMLALAGAAVLGWLLSWAQSYTLAYVSERISADLRNRTYSHLHQLSLEFFGGKRTGSLISRISTDTDRICYFISVHLPDFCNDILMICMTAAILLWIDPLLALATLIPVPIVGWLIHTVRKRLGEGFQQGSRAWAEMTSVLADTIPGVRVVKAFAQENREVERFCDANQRIVAANDGVNIVWSFFWTIIALLTQAGVLIIWACGAWRIGAGAITVGLLTMFLAYISRFYGRLESMSRMFGSTERAANSARRIFEILDRQPSVPEPTRPANANDLQGDIELRQVNFKYGSRQVIFDINLHIRPGEMIGLVGPSGAGKSTLANLICRFYDVAEGSILVDGTDIRSFRVAEYRRHIGIVLQEPFLFFGTIAENIAYGRPQATRAEIVAAARAAQAHEFILRLADGYDSLVGERGQSLSGGERQRISIARALLIDPAILILDEATSAVDTETEREIQGALDNLTRGRTTLAIAHRLSTLRKADRIVVLERGRIVEVGPHDQLLKAEGAYFRLHQAQRAIGGVLGDALPLPS